MAIKIAYKKTSSAKQGSNGVSMGIKASGFADCLFSSSKP